MSDQEPAPFTLSRELDLHTFLPKDIPSVVEEYLLEARRLGFKHVRIVHGKGIGFQREAVRKVLSVTPFVTEYEDDSGNRGATWATLKA